MNGLSFGSAQQHDSSNFTSIKKAEGVFVDHGPIKAAKLEYNSAKVPTWESKDDVGIRMIVAVAGQDWDREIYVGGRFKRDGTGQGGVISGWGSAFKVARVFDELGIEGEVGPQGQIPQLAIDLLIGREIFYLQYVNRVYEGKAKYETYGVVAAQRENETPEETAQRLYELWQKDSYEQKRYRPELLSDGGSDDSFGFGANAETADGTSANEVAQTADLFAPDGDSPF